MMRKSEIIRETNETKIQLKLNLDGKKNYSFKTGIAFLDHMLELFCFHSSLDLDLSCQGDLKVDAHHTVEDIGIVLGKAINDALGDKKGICRYATVYLPMDETLTRTNLDFSGRFYHVFKVSFSNNFLGNLPTEMVEHFFYSLACNTNLTLHQELIYGSNDHHKVESLFKGFGLSLKQAIKIDGNLILSSKGSL